MTKSNRKRRSGLILAASAAVAGVVLAAPVAHAQTWTPGGGGSWNSTANWNPATIPNAVGAAVVFDTPTAARTVTVDSGATGFTLGSITSTNNSNPVFSQSITTGTTGSNLIFDETGAGPGSITVNGTGLGNFTLSAPLVLNDSVVITVNQTSQTSTAGAFNWTGSATGSGGMTKQGPGLMTMASPLKSYTGPTVFDTNSGRVRISSAGRPGSTSSVTVKSGAQINFITDGFNSTLGPGTLFLNGTGLGASSYPGNFPGAIRNDTNIAVTIQNPIELQSDTLIHVQGSATGVTTFAKPVSGVGSLTLTALNSDNNLGKLVLSNTGNTYSGGTIINGGTLDATAGTLGATTGPLTANVISFGGAQSTVLLNTTSPTTTGSLSGTRNASANSLTINNGGQLYTVNQTTAGTYEGVIAGAGGFALGNLSTSTLALIGANTYTGPTTVNAGKLSVNPAAIPASNNVTVNGGEYEMGQGGGVYKPASLTVNAGKASITGVSSLMDTSAINIGGTTDAWTGQLDITSNDAILRSSDANRVSDVARITNQLKQGLNASPNSNQALFWTGQGIVTSNGWQGGSNYTGVGVTYNDKAAAGLPTAPLYTSFDGQTVGINDVLVKYTWFGDADLDGAVTSNDYFQIDTGFLGNKTGWINGDFDYNGVINSNDYFLIDSAFLAQAGTVLAPAGASLPAGVTAVPEPASLGLIAFTGAAMLLRRRHQKK